MKFAIDGTDNFRSSRCISMRMLRIGPDEVHKMTLAKRELETRTERRTSVLDDNGPLATV